MLISAALVGARLAHYAALTILFGLSLFPFYAGGPRPIRRPVLIAAALTVPVSGLLWLMFSTATMSGDLAAAFDPATLAQVVREMAFGRIWAARLALALLTLGLVMVRPGSRWIPALGGLMLASIALTGHAQMEAGPSRLIHMGADGLHLLAAGVWLGALIPILALARQTGSDQVALGAILARFSRTATLAVATLVGSGLVNAGFLVGSVQGLVSTDYGHLLMIKLVLFAGMLGLAAHNRWRLTPRLLAAGAAADLRGQLRRQVLAEQVLGLLVLAVVALMGTSDPASSSA